ncbi:MAG: hypothetical protein FWE63_03845 [Bacteroidales bacterium]|nr:hypothetical protein [Bacteroidales bacterium]
MSVHQFMSEHISDIREIIDQMERPFDSHAFIKKFAKNFQVEYVDLLSQYEQDLFENVHKQIGKFLSEKSAILGIQSAGRVSSENVFGEVNDNENWL